MKYSDKTDRRSKGGDKNPRKSGGRELEKKILEFFQKNDRKRFDVPQLAHKLKLRIPYSEIDQCLGLLAARGNIINAGEGKFKLVRDYSRPGNNRREERTSSEPLIGKVDMTKSGDAFIIVDGMDNDIFVQNRRLKHAMNGDIVEVVLKRGGRRKQEGAVTKIVERKREKFIGKLKQFKNKFYVDAEDRFLSLSIEVQADAMGEAKADDLVMVKVTKWPSGKMDFPQGEILHALGKIGSNELAMQQILLNQGFDPAFSEDLLAEADALEDGTKGPRQKGRKDLRSITTFTIDPDTAKDFDDALSVKYSPDGTCEIGIHIADVTHYVTPGTELDKEAFNRSTSVYLVDRVAPMLPERLSNELCSLRPNEDKCTFSAIFTFDNEDNIVKKWIGKTLTHSNRRFTYEEAQEIIETGKGEFSRELKKLNRMAEKMRKDRFKEGAINFESDEVKFKLDETGKPLEVYIKERKAAHMLVEEFMLLANKHVAIYINEKNQKGPEIPYVYRVHDTPDPDKVNDFAKFAMELGIKMDVSNPKAIARSFNMLSKASAENTALRMLGPMAIRTMAKAIYTTENIGHYGLAFDNYAHFTSPIRRYADVLVHRILHKNLTEDFRMSKSELEAKCKHISNQEKKAADAERESVKLKLVEYMEGRIGQLFEGHVTGIIDRGIFVQLAGVMAEGMVGFDNMAEPYVVADSRLKARGKRSGRMIKMGDKIKVRVLSVDMDNKRIELEEVKEADEKS